MKNILLFFVIVIPSLVCGQKQETLSGILWGRVNNCYSMFEDMNDDGVLDFNKIDDSQNGYLKISGSWQLGKKNLIQSGPKKSVTH